MNLSVYMCEYFCLEGELVTARSAELIPAQVSLGRREEEEQPPGNPFQINLLTRRFSYPHEESGCLFALGHFHARSN